MIGGKPKVSDLVIGARNMIEAADIRPRDSVLLLADRSSDGNSIDALASALRLHGATPMEMIVEPMLRYGDVPEAALRAMEAVDVAVWVWPVFLNGSTNYRERLRRKSYGKSRQKSQRSRRISPCSFSLAGRNPGSKRRRGCFEDGWSTLKRLPHCRVPK